MKNTGISCVLALLTGLVSMHSMAADTATIKQLAVSQIHPTQPAVGYDEIRYKVALYKANPGELFDSFCEENGAGKASHYDSQSLITQPDSFSCQSPYGTHPEAIKSAVIAPDHQVYLTDGHHTISVYRDIAGDKSFTFSVRITNDMSSLPDMAAFWTWMQQHNLTWLKDPAGNSVVPANLPAQVGMKFMADDTYRSVLYFLRSVSYKKPQDAPPFLEFYLGDWLRHHQPAGSGELTTKAGYAAYLSRAAATMVAAEGSQHTTSDASSPTLDQLGKLDTVNQKKLDKLTQPGGKLSVLFGGSAVKA